MMVGSMMVSEECRYCGTVTLLVAGSTMVKKGPPCEVCASKLALIVRAMPDPRTTCCKVAPGGHGWCRKPARHDEPDEEGRADPVHVVNLRTDDDATEWTVPCPRPPEPASLPVVSTSDPEECLCHEQNVWDADCPIPAHQAKAALAQEKRLIAERKDGMDGEGAGFRSIDLEERTSEAVEALVSRERTRVDFDKLFGRVGDALEACEVLLDVVDTAGDMNDLGPAVRAVRQALGRDR